jgi:uncharacterized protein (DUF302 family)
MRFDENLQVSGIFIQCTNGRRTAMDTQLGLTVRLKVDFETAVKQATDALQAEGFGVLTEIDVAGTMKRKLGVDMPPYRILGACNAPLAHRALTISPEVGLLLPCNVVVRKLDERLAEVSLVDPQVMLAAAGKPELKEIATEARAKLERVASALARGGAQL